MSHVSDLRSSLGWILGRFVARAVRHIPPRIFDRVGESPYLVRYHLVGGPFMPDGSSPFDAEGKDRRGMQWPERPWGLYVHHFRRSDADQELHSHPWAWAISLVISGGYCEERRVGDEVITRVMQPLSFNFIRNDDFHRVDLLDADAWTLFLVGPKASSWAFWDRWTGELTPWRAFLARKAART